MTREVQVGSVKIGGDAPVVVQTMYDRPLGSIPNDPDFVRRMQILKNMGMGVIRFSYPDIAEHDALKYVVENSPVPVVADIHFDYKNAIDAIECGVAKIRINPGNIGPRWKTGEVVKAALDRGAAIRIGLNSGSLPKNDDNKEIPSLMAETALEYIGWFEKLGFYNTVVSLKASDSELTYKTNKLFSEKSDYPLHLGVTEAGGVVSSCVRSTWTLGRLLSEGIGNTIRYSITGSIEDEVYAGAELLSALGLRERGMRIVSCPMCGRKTFNTQEFLRSAEAEILSCGRNLTVAIMGCQVNGPGEARNANIAVSGVGRKIFLYKDGEICLETTQDGAKEALLKLIAEY